MKLHFLRNVWQKLKTASRADTTDSRKPDPALESEYRDSTHPPKQAMNRHGLPILPPEQDLGTLFEEPPPSGVTTASQTKPRKRRKTKPPKPAPKTLKSGLPILDDKVDLYNLFDVAEADQAATTESRPAKRSPRKAEAEKEEFKRLLEASFQNPALKSMMATKQQIDRRRPLPENPLDRYPGVEARLDLHGQTAADAHREALTFLHSATLNNLLTVKIIVGKGLHSQSGPVLRDVVEELLFELKRQGKVYAFKWERRQKRKSGAVVIYLPRP